MGVEPSLELQNMGLHECTQDSSRNLANARAGKAEPVRGCRNPRALTL